MAGQHFSLFLALRYLRPKRTFLSLITLISVAGVTLGVTVLILVISVMTGFDRELRDKVIGFDAHLLVTSPSVMAQWREARDTVLATTGVVAASPYVQGPVLVEFDNRRLAPKIRGIDPEEESRVTDIRQFIRAGSLDLDGDKAVLGSEMARILGIGIGDKLVVYSPGNLNAVMEELKRLEATPDAQKASQELREMILPAELEVAGIFESGRYLYDSEFLLVPLHVGQELYGMGDAVHGLTLKTVDPYRAEEIRGDLLDRLPPDLAVATWMDLNRELFDAIRMERNVMFFLLLFIIVVAAFGIMNTLITVTVQKTREIGIIKALGARTSQIVWVFLAQGIVVGALGSLTGLLLGMNLVQYRNQVSQALARVLGIEIFPPSIYQFAEIPAQVVPQDVAIICTSAFAICSVAALIPAYFAARLDPVRALRYE